MIMRQGPSAEDGNYLPGIGDPTPPGPGDATTPSRATSRHHSPQATPFPAWAPASGAWYRAAPTARKGGLEPQDRA